MLKDKAKEIKPHPKYYNKDSIVVPSVTQITGAFADQQKVGGLMGYSAKNPKTYKDMTKRAAAIGTLAHYLVECHCKDEEPVVEGFDDEMLEQAYSCYYAWVDWFLQAKGMVLGSELEVVSERYCFGGTIDLLIIAQSPDDGFGKINLVDIKTGSIYDEMTYQVAAYRQLYQENYDMPIDRVLILQLSKDGEGYTEHWIPGEELDKGWEIFKLLREVIRIKEG